MGMKDGDLLHNEAELRLREMLEISERYASYYNKTPKELGLSVSEMFVTVPKQIKQDRMAMKILLREMIDIIERMHSQGAGYAYVSKYRRMVDVIINLL